LIPKPKNSHKSFMAFYGVHKKIWLFMAFYGVLWLFMVLWLSWFLWNWQRQHSGGGSSGSTAVAAATAASVGGSRHAVAIVVLFCGERSCRFASRAMGASSLN
jgi:hypothetical protein